MKRIIVNADDFGINEVVTSEIERMAELGAISSTTVMANGTCLDEVKRFASLHPEISFGLHLCLSEFGSVTKSLVLKKYGLIGDHGCFVHKQIFKIRKYDDDLKTAIKAELNAQIHIVKSLGIPISHADSHHHVHTIYPLREVFAEVLQENGIKRIRIGQDFRNWRSKRHIIQWAKRVRLNQFYSSHFSTIDEFYSYSDYLSTKHNDSKKIVELMCHPGHPGKKYRDEMGFVEAKAAFAKEDIKMITYNEIY